MHSAANVSYVFPVEIFERILDGCHQHQDIAAFAASSRWLNRIATRKLYKNIQLDNSADFTTAKRLLRTIKSTPELAALVERLALDWSETIIEEEESTCVDDFTFDSEFALPNARELHVRGSAVAGAEGLIEIPTDLVRTCNPARLTHLTWLPALGDKTAPWPALPQLEWLQVSSAAIVAGLRVCGGLSALHTLVYTPDRTMIDMEDAGMLSSVLLLLPQVETMCLDEGAVVRLGLDASREANTTVPRVRRLGLLDGCALSCPQCHVADAQVPSTHHCTSVTQLIAQRVISRFDALEVLDLDCRSMQWQPSTHALKACGERCDTCSHNDVNKALLYAFNHEMSASLPQSLRQVNVCGTQALERSEEDQVFQAVRCK